MRTSKTITWTILLLTISLTTIKGQSTDKDLKRIWELISVEPLGVGMGGLGEDMKLLDLRYDSQLVFQDGEHSDTISYKIIDQEIRLFDKVGNPLGYELIWKIERLTEKEFSLLFIAREDKKGLMRLKYRAKD